MARRGAGTLLVPVTWEALVLLRPGSGGEAIVQRSGVNLVREVPGVARWLAGFDGPMVLGTYVCADGAANLAVRAAVDLLTLRLRAARGDLALAFLVSPTDVIADQLTWSPTPGLRGPLAHRETGRQPSNSLAA
jgi:hypothetical protein